MGERARKDLGRAMRPGIRQLLLQLAALAMAGTLTACGGGGGGGESVEASASPSPTVAGAADGLRLRASAPSWNQVSLSWNPQQGASSYLVHEGQDPQPLARTTDAQYLFASARPGGAYQYRVVAIDAQGREVSRSEAVRIVTPTLAPAAPQAVSEVRVSARGLGHNHLEWDAPIGGDAITGYTIYRSDLVEPIGSTSAHSFDDLGAAAGESYAYRVVAVDALERQSALAVSAQIRSPVGSDRTAPSVPGDLAGQLTVAGYVKLEWSASGDNVGVQAYELVRQDVGVAMKTDSGTSYTDDTVEPGRSYTYRLRAVDASANRSAWSAAYTIAVPGSQDTTPPTAPRSLQALSVSQTEVRLSWSASTDNVGIAKYEIRRGAGRGVRFESTQTAYADTTVHAGSYYVYRVRAVDTAGNKSPWSESAVVQVRDGKDTVAPTAPTQLRAQPDSATQVTLTWNASTDNVGVTRYQVLREGRMVADVTATRWVDTSAQAGTGYVYHVRALDAANNASPLSESAQVRTPPLPDTEAPGAPSALSARAQGSSQIELRWGASTDNVGIDRYEIFRVGGKGVLASVNATTYVDKGLTPGTTYSYQVRAADAANNYSPLSAIAQATTDRPQDSEPPSTPSNVKAAAAADGSKVSIAWSASTDNVGVLEYSVRRDGRVIVANLRRTNWDDAEALQAGAQYSYQVEAYDAAGNVSSRSVAVLVKMPLGKDSEPPTVPTGVKATAAADGSKVSIAWSASTDNVGVLEYSVRRDGRVIVANLRRTNWDDAEALQAGARYSYQVEAYDAAGNVSPRSAAVAVVMPEAGGGGGGGGGGKESVVKAASCSRADIQSAIDKARSGDVVEVPAGQCDWPDRAIATVLQKSLWIRGAGKDKTRIRRGFYINDSNTSEFDRALIGLFVFRCDAATRVRFSDLTLEGNGTEGTFSNEDGTFPHIVASDYGVKLFACRDFRIHDARFTRFGYAGVEVNSQSLTGSPQDTQGLIDHNEFIGNLRHGWGYGVDVNGVKNWPAPEYGSAHNVFIESNYFEDNRHNVAAGYGARYVFRHNEQVTTLRASNWGMVDAHGRTSRAKDGNGQPKTRGTRSFEVYRNVFRMRGIPSGTPGMSATGPSIRGGDGVIFENVFDLGNRWTGGPHSGDPIGIYVTIESDYSDGTCLRSPVEYPTEDQTTDLYIWGNTDYQGKANNNVSTGGDNWNRCDAFIKKDRDYHFGQRPGYQPFVYPHPLQKQAWPTP